MGWRGCDGEGAGKVTSGNDVGGGGAWWRVVVVGGGREEVRWCGSTVVVANLALVEGGGLEKFRHGLRPRFSIPPKDF